MLGSKQVMWRQTMMAATMLPILVFGSGCSQQKSAEPMRASDYTSTIPASALPPDLKQRMDDVAKDPKLTEVQKHAEMARLGREAYLRNSQH